MKFDTQLQNYIDSLGLEYPNYIIGTTANDVVLGISWLWGLPNTHKFYPASIIHDFEYEKRMYDTSLIPDQRFLRNCLKLAGKSTYYKMQRVILLRLIST